MQQFDEMLSVDLVHIGCIGHQVRLNGARVITTDQPLIQTLHGQFTGTPPRALGRRAFIPCTRAALGGPFRNTHRPGSLIIIVVIVFAQRAERSRQVGHLDRHAGGIGALFL